MNEIDGGCFNSSSMHNNTFHNIKNKDWYSDLHAYSIMDGDYDDIVKHLIGSDADIDQLDNEAKDDDGRSKSIKKQLKKKISSKKKNKITYKSMKQK
jgi:hypothetical protein